MDVLSDILDTLRMRSCLYFTTDFRPPWGVAVPAYGNVARFHLVMSGACWISIEPDGPAHALREGDLVLIPHGRAHVLSDVPGGPALDVGDMLRDRGLDERGCLVFGGAGEEGATRLLCGHFEFGADKHPLIDALPSEILIRRDGSGSETWIEPILRLLAQEAGAGRDGGGLVMNRLTDVLFVQAIRHWSAGGDRRGLMSAISDRRIGRSLRAIHARPDGPWTVNALAREAGLSRTLFAERFRALVGQPPIHYVTALRIRRARQLLQDSAWSIDRIAAEVGYRSPAAFARMFRRMLGKSPGSIRRAAQSPAPR